MKCRTYLMTLVLAAVVPVLVCAGTVVGLFATEQWRVAEQELRESTRAVAMAIDRKLASVIATLEALSTDLEAGTLNGFRARALLLVARHPSWTAIEVFDTAGRLLLTTGPPAGAPASIADRPYFQTAIATGRPAVSGYAPSPVTGEPAFAVVVPVSAQGRLRYALCTTVTPRALSTLLADQQRSPEWLGAIVDADGIILARTAAAEVFVGRPATPDYVTRTRDRREDVFRGQTLDGGAAYASFGRVRTSDWTVAISVPAALVDGPIWRSVVAVTGAGAVLLAFGLAVAIVLGRRIAWPLGALASSAPRLARGEPVSAVPGPVTEVNELGRALQDASLERRASEQALRASERAERRLAAQHAVTRMLAEAESLDDTAPRLIEALCHALDCDAGEIWRVDREAGVARCIEALATSPAADGFAAAARGRVIARGAGLTGRAWLGGKCVWIREFAPEADVAPAEAAAAGLRSAVAFPLIHAEVLGVASFYCRRVWEPDADVLDMLASVGSQVGQFIERRRAERERADLLAMTAQALRDVEASERRYRQLVEALPHVAWTAAPDGALDYLNRHWFDYTGLTPSESVGDGWTSAVHPDDLERTLECWRHARAAGEGFDLEHRLRRRDGFYRWFLGRVAPVRDAAGAVATWLGVAVDIDAQKRAEQGAVDASRAKDNFLATLSHELRTPLTATLGWVRLLRTGRLDPATARRALETIERNVHVQTQLIEDLLDVSRIVAGKLDLRVVPVDLGRLVEEAVDAVRPAAEARGLAVEVTIDDGARRSAGDPARLQQVLGNLLTNAVKFTDRGGRIGMRLERRNGRGRISVWDTGKGIAPELLPHVFDRFRQGRVAGERGLGLGLAIVKQIVELHGGSVYAESEGEGRGATFVVVLALADDGP